MTTVVDLLRDAAHAHGGRAAVEWQGGSLSHAELYRRSNRLARRLREDGAEKGAVVAVGVEDPVERIAAILGVMKAGCVFAPLEASFPPKRLEAAVLEISPAWFVFDRAFAARTSPARWSGAAEAAGGAALERRILFADAQEPAGAIADDSPAPDVPIAPEDPCYLYFTSGSTGRPKAILGCHKGLAHFIRWEIKTFGIDPTHRISQLTPPTFDPYLRDVLVPLCSGAAVCVPESRDIGLDGARLARWIEERRVTLIHCVPTVFRALVHAEPDASSFGALRYVLIAGEPLYPAPVARWMRTFGERVQLVNLYGPSETTLAKLCHFIGPADLDRRIIPVGKPIEGARALVLDDRGRICPPGVIGEIVLRTPFRTLGYYRRPDLTSEVFVPNPLSDDPADIVYKTGDMGRQLKDGSFEVLGRRDQQVKIRGHRVEIGEIEALLRGHPGVLDAAVKDWPGADQERQLCAYLVLEGAGAAAPRRLPVLGADAVETCARCGLPSNYPGASFDKSRVCATCLAFDSTKERAASYFKTMDDLRRRFEAGRARRKGAHDCLMLLSGGKDSTYVLYQLVAMGLDVLVMSFDNGFLSEGAKANIRRVVEALGVEHVFATTPFMNRIFADSLRRFSNVCNGCFKAIYTLSANLSRARGIPFIVTGLSRGQLFETRLSDLYSAGIFDPEEIDRIVLETRKVYHRLPDEVSRTLDVRVFEDDAFFEEVQFVDFFRYADVTLGEILAFLAQNAPWIRPEDTGRSTNCRINDTGIWVHKRERGYHNYALPYAWDVRMGHKTRQAALEELDDRIDEASVRRILEEIGYEPAGPVAGGETRGDTEDVLRRIREHLQEHLPAAMIPSAFVVKERLPLLPNGKVDRRALPAPDAASLLRESEFVPPRDAVELALAQIWEGILDIRPVGVRSSFFMLGGHSILAVRLMSRIHATLGKTLPLAALFGAETIEQLARLLRREIEPAPFSPLVAVQPRGRSRPLYCVHPAGGNALCYLDLAHSLGPDQPVYGLQARGLDERRAPDERVEDMAAAYLDAIRAAQPAGPYLLAGWSFGGLVAFEMAQALVRRGERVGLLALIDTYPMAQDGRPPLAGAALVQDLVGADVPLSLAHMERLPPDEQIAYVLEQARKVHLIPPDVGPDRAARLLRVFRANTQAGRAYTPSHYPGRAHLFRALEEPPGSGAPDLTAFWGRLLTGGVETHWVAGSHRTLGRRPHVQGLADALKPILAEVERIGDD
jgi:amino acid adenylation domain-containing protein